jgi:hypothetical protein
MLSLKNTKAPLLAALISVAAVGAGDLATAQAQGYGWRYGPGLGGYYAGQEVARDKVEAAVKAALGKAAKGTLWTSPRGVKYTPITVDGQVIGHLWEDADLGALQVGAYWAGRFGQKAELTKDGRVVGMIWVNLAS